MATPIQIVKVGLTAGDRSPTTMRELEEGVILHRDDDGRLLAIEVLELGRRGGFGIDKLDDEGISSGG